MSLSVTIEGLDKLEAKLGKLTAKSTLRGLLVSAANELVDRTAPYPPAPSYGGDRWYERGRGGFWRRKDGSIGGPNPVSQNLGAQWTVKPQGDDVVIKNEADYAGYVHDKERQVGFHAGRGWKTIQDEWDKGQKEIVGHMTDEIMDIWGS